MDMYFSVEKFRAAYEEIIPPLPDKSQWPHSNHGFFLYPPLLKPTSGRRKTQRHKGCTEGGTGRKGRHQCPICKQFGHHWCTCKEGDPYDVAAMKAARYLNNTLKQACTIHYASMFKFQCLPDVGRGEPKKRKKKAVEAPTEGLRICPNDDISLTNS